MSIAPARHCADLSLPLADRKTIEAAIRRNAAERRLLNRLLRVHHAREHEEVLLGGECLRNGGSPPMSSTEAARA
jgi:hypothetical protein